VWLLIKENNSSELTSASEYSGYVFCPVSTIISNRFVVPATVVQHVGTEMHERTLLINKFLKVDGETVASQQDFAKSPDHFEDSANKDFFNDINSSKLILSGHMNDSKPFSDNKSKFIGQPDYIFENSKGGRFIVEEKFRFLSSGQSKVSLYRSHRIQLLSYIYMLNSLNIEYGYVIYWVSQSMLGTYGNEFIAIDRCVAIRIDRTNKNRLMLGDVYREYRDVKFKGKQVELPNESINPAKCGSCSLNMFCVHKVKNQPKVTINSSYEDLFKVKYLPFPADLIKSAEEKAQELKNAEIELQRKGDIGTDIVS
jgi:CRISPR/Cas system-associated exonuclease Cas4 (RecB family)